jgi:hypothetical protein
MTDAIVAIHAQPQDAPKLRGAYDPVGWAGWVLFAVLVILYSDLAESTIERSLTPNGTVFWTAVALVYFSGRRGHSGWLQFRGVMGFVRGLCGGLAGVTATTVICSLVRGFL